MSTSYIPRIPIKFDEIVKWVGTKPHLTETSTSPFTAPGTESIYIEDENHNIMTVYKSGQNAVFKRWGANQVEKIIERIEEKFKTEVLSEHDDEYWELSNDVDYPDGNFYI